MVFLAIVCGFTGLVLGFFGVGFGAAALLEAAKGSREGAASMAGFFYFGPAGAIAGALLGVGLILRFRGGAPSWGNGLLIASGVILIVGGMLLAAAALPESGPSYSYAIEFEMEVPEATLAGVDIPSANAMWGSASSTFDDKPISQFFDKRCEDGACVLRGAIAAIEPLDNFRIAAHLGPKQYRFLLDVPTPVTGPVDWSEWRSSDGARIRWQIVKR